MKHEEKLRLLAVAESTYAALCDGETAALKKLQVLMDFFCKFQTGGQESDFWSAIWDIVSIRQSCVDAYAEIQRLQAMIKQQAIHPTPESHPMEVAGPPKTLKNLTSAKTRK